MHMSSGCSSFSTNLVSSLTPSFSITPIEFAGYAELMAHGAYGELNNTHIATLVERHTRSRQGDG